jgi:formylglycine-generating enzyme required for sulfatase activity
MAAPHSAPPRQLAELGDFLTALQVNGIPVGPGDIDRLRQLFALKPTLDRDSLKALLSALLVKHPEQHRLFENLFDDWCPDREADWPEDVPEPISGQNSTSSASRGVPPQPFSQDPDDVTEPEPAWSRLATRGIPVVIGLLLCALITWHLLPEPIVIPPAPIDTLQPAKLPPGPVTLPTDLPATPTEQVWFWRAAVDVKGIHTPWRIGPAELLLLGLAALATAGAMWRRYRQRLRPLPSLPPAYGHGWQPLLPPAGHDSALIDARDQRQLVWNIEHFISDDPSRRLDLKRTVDATARSGGFVRMHFQPHVYNREVWFWLDRQLDRSTPRLAAQQLSATLRATGLEARQGWFTDLPERVDWPEQRGYRPAQEEGYGRQAFVAIFSDGEGLEYRLQHARHRVAAERLLRALSRWPRLRFVDCSSTPGRLQSLIAPYGLDAIALDELPNWLGGTVQQQASPVVPDDTASSEDRAWSAAVALGGAQADTASAHSLRLYLGLSASPWRVDEILARALKPDERNGLVNWLLRCEPLGVSHTPKPGSLAWRALQWWQQRYADSARQMQERENRLLPWRDSLASRRWQLEQALLLLYQQPEAATRKLVQLANSGLDDDVRERLAGFAAAEHLEAGLGHERRYIYLTWRLTDLPADLRRDLHHLDFAKGLSPSRPATLKDAPRFALAMTALAMLALTAFAVAAQRWWTPNPPRFQTNPPAIAAQTVQLREPLGWKTYRVTLGHVRQAKWLPPFQAPAGADIPVKWSWEVEPNAVQLEGSDSVVLRAGQFGQAIRACSQNWPARSLVIIDSPTGYDDVSARQLAIRLLDKGSADQVLIGTDWADHLASWLGPSLDLNRLTQVLVILPQAAETDTAIARLASHTGPWAVTSSDDFAELARDIEFTDNKLIGQVSSDQLTVHHTHGEVRMNGGPETERADGITWVHACPGTFKMGSLQGEDAQANSNEIVAKPRYVALSPFWIAATETMQEQYDQIDPVNMEANKQPMVPINWADAQAFCQRVQGDLPTEAQWEYAARAGTSTAYSFGDDATLLKDYAWYKDNANQLQGVGQLKPNPWGLYDMHGNVWEWTRDWYDTYASGELFDPTGPKSGSYRVLRGGSFDDPPELLRSARRGFDLPEDRVGRFGFRCVRVPRP